jgi:hypothetical protein
LRITDEFGVRTQIYMDATGISMRAANWPIQIETTQQNGRRNSQIIGHVTSE